MHKAQTHAREIQQQCNAREIQQQCTNIGPDLTMKLWLLLAASFELFVASVFHWLTVATQPESHLSLP